MFQSSVFPYSAKGSRSRILSVTRISVTLASQMHSTALLTCVVDASCWAAEARQRSAGLASLYDDTWSCCWLTDPRMELSQKLSIRPSLVYCHKHVGRYRLIFFTPDRCAFFLDCCWYRAVRPDSVGNWSTHIFLLFLSLLQLMDRGSHGNWKLGYEVAVWRRALLWRRTQSSPVLPCLRCLSVFILTDSSDQDRSHSGQHLRIAIYVNSFISSLYEPCQRNLKVFKPSFINFPGFYLLLFAFWSL